MDALDLDSARWKALRHAYGPAVDTPRLLRKLESRDKDALNEVYNSLFHQSDVYPASYAAVPHLVRIAASTGAGLAAEILILAGGIHARRDSSQLASLESDIVAWYEAAIPAALSLALHRLDARMAKSKAIYLLQSAAAFAGHGMSGRFLDGFNDGEFTLACPECEADLSVRPDRRGLKATAGDPDDEEADTSVRVRPGLAAGSGLATEYRWLKKQCARASLRSMMPSIEALFGTVACPSCDAEFALADELAKT
jgi:hypothetical protein